MQTYNIHEAKTQLSKLVEMAWAGLGVVIVAQSGHNNICIHTYGGHYGCKCFCTGTYR